MDGKAIAQLLAGGTGHKSDNVGKAEVPALGADLKKVDAWERFRAPLPSILEAMEKDREGIRHNHGDEREPVGLSTSEVISRVEENDGKRGRTKVAFRTASKERFVQVIEAAVEHFKDTHGQIYPTPERLAEYLPRNFPKTLLERLFQDDTFYSALRMRGIQPPDEPLTERQLMCIAVLSDFTSTKSIKGKLTDLGIKWWEYQAWLAQPRFAKKHRDASEALFEKAQAAVNSQLVAGAVSGKLDYIREFNVLSGRNDPARKQMMDVRDILNGVVDILTRNISDQPELLMKISGELSALAGGSGAYGKEL